MLGQSPPTTSGVVVLSGSNNFGIGGDFPAFGSIVVDFSHEELPTGSPLDLVGPETAQTVGSRILRLVDLHLEEPFPTIGITPRSPTVPVLQVDTGQESFIVDTYLEFAATSDNLKITSTNTTTSGVVVIDLYPGANLTSSGIPPYVPPTFINQRVFPTFSGIAERLFPEENRRIYPVLPQFSVITPGD